LTDCIAAVCSRLLFVVVCFFYRPSTFSLLFLLLSAAGCEGTGLLSAVVKRNHLSFFFHVQLFGSGLPTPLLAQRFSVLPADHLL